MLIAKNYVFETNIFWLFITLFHDKKKRFTQSSQRWTMTEWRTCWAPLPSRWRGFPGSWGWRAAGQTGSRTRHRTCPLTSSETFRKDSELKICIWKNWLEIRVHWKTLLLLEYDNLKSWICLIISCFLLFKTCKQYKL